MPEREMLTLEPIADAPEVGRWLSAMEDGRRDTLRELEGVTDPMVDARPPGSDNSIGTTLYHVALVEADWLFDDLLGIPLSDSELAASFPMADRDDEGALAELRGESLAMHLARLVTVREVLMQRFRTMDAEDFHTPRVRERFDISPAWVIHHLLQHESEHRSEIGRLKHQLMTG